MGLPQHDDAYTHPTGRDQYQQMQVPYRPINSGKVYITSKEFEAKYRDKRECYRFLASDVKVYLDSYETMTIWHLKDLAAGRKKKILSKAIKHIDIP